MLESIMYSYKSKCTRAGQFSFLLDNFTITLAIFVLWAVLVFFTYKLFHGRIDNLAFLYLILLMFLFAVIIYLAFCSWRIFIKCKKYTIEKLKKLRESSLDEEIKTNLSTMIATIDKSSFKFKYIFNRSFVEELYNVIRFDEFVDSNKINTPKELQIVLDSFEIYLSDSSNFKSIIDAAFIGTVFLTILKPVVEYMQSIYIPISSTRFLDTDLLFYLFITITLCLLFLCIIKFVLYLNDSKNKNKKELLRSLVFKLRMYDLDKNRIERYLDVEFKEN